MYGVVEPLNCLIDSWVIERELHRLHMIKVFISLTVKSRQNRMNGWIKLFKPSILKALYAKVMNL